jgi:hypothetical protein
MTKILILLFSTLSTIAFTQIGENKILYSDTTFEITKLNKVTLDNLSSLLVCFNIGDCKGFICELDTIGTRLEDMDIRACVTRVNEFEFKIEYKYRDSKSFLTDTFHLYCMDNQYSIALPLKSTQFEINPNNYGNWLFFPASTDERDVVFYTQIGNQILLYLKKTTNTK